MRPWIIAASAVMLAAFSAPSGAATDQLNCVLSPQDNTTYGDCRENFSRKKPKEVHYTKPPEKEYDKPKKNKHAYKKNPKKYPKDKYAKKCDEKCKEHLAKKFKYIIYKKKMLLAKLYWKKKYILSKLKKPYPAPMQPNKPTYDSKQTGSYGTASLGGSTIGHGGTPSGTASTSNSGGLASTANNAGGTAGGLVSGTTRTAGGVVSGVSGGLLK